MKIKLTLASASPHRRRIIESMGIPFEVLPTQALELNTHPEGASALVLENAKLKAVWMLDHQPEAFVLTSDTVVTLGEEIFNKPTGLAEAKKMLQKMSGKTVDVYTSACLRHQPTGINEDHVEITKLFMANYNDQAIEHYFTQLNPLVLSGALGLEIAMESAIISKFEGSASNCIGLPKEYLEDLFSKITWPTTTHSN